MRTMCSREIFTKKKAGNSRISTQTSKGRGAIPKYLPPISKIMHLIKVQTKVLMKAKRA